MAASGNQCGRTARAASRRAVSSVTPEDGLNSEEQSVAWYFEKQAQLLWWYRNLSRQDYRLQGWRKNGIYPDFIVSRTNAADKTDFDKEFVDETKGIHQKNDDTD